MKWVLLNIEINSIIGENKIMKVTWNGGLHKDLSRLQSPARMGREDCAYMFYNFLHTYFLDATSHHIGIDAPFTANFYHERAFPRYGTVVEIPPGPSIPSTFTDRLNEILSEVVGSPNIKLVYQNRFIGVLCPETQTLWATDWTHGSDSSYRNCTKHIILYLAKQGFIQPAPVDATKSKKKEAKTPPEKNKFSITIGGDPEFELVDNGGYLLRAGDEETRFEIFTPCGDIGLDGSGDQIELRPSPGNPEVVVNNVRSLLVKFGEMYSDEFRLAASSDGYPCGGHIHIGVEPKPDESYYITLSQILDDFIGYPTKRLNGGCRGNGGEYGRINDWRTQDHGMEYRTPPSAIWKNPSLTMVVLKLTYNLAQSLANNLQLEYDTPVIFDDLVSVGGLLPEEATFYMDECQKRAPHSDECLLAAWGIKVDPPKPHKPKLIIEFQEDWNSEVKRTLRSYFERVKITKSTTITCYGLKESRGDVYTFEMPGKSVVEHPQTRGLGATYFGFSRKFRMGSISERDIRDAADKISRVVLEIQDGTIPPKPIEGSGPFNVGSYTAPTEVSETFGIYPGLFQVPEPHNPIPSAELDDRELARLLGIS